jgi:ABC-type Na+ efflux pump permease subunit
VKLKHQAIFESLLIVLIFFFALEIALAVLHNKPFMPHFYIPLFFSFLVLSFFTALPLCYFFLDFVFEQGLAEVPEGKAPTASQMRIDNGGESERKGTR